MSNNIPPKSNSKQIKVSPILAKILSEALLYAKQNLHQFLTPEHILSCSLNEKIVKDFLVESGADFQKLKTDVTHYLDTETPRIVEFAAKGNMTNPIESAGFQSVMNRAVLHCISADKTVIDITDIFVSMIEEKTNYCSYFLRINGVDKLKLIEIISKNNTNSKNMIPPGMEEFVTNNKGGLKRFCTDFTQLAKDGLFDTLIGRNEEIERTIQILCRRTKNNPLHVGDAGVGKTAITQGLAQRIVEGKVPNSLKNFSLYSLNLGSLLAGAKFRGDFEERLNSILNELKEKKNCILYIDEIHMIMGAGTNGSTQMDAANLLKPILATGEVKFIGSTTFDEYQKNFEKDRALARRFQKIDILEPTKQETLKILKGLIKKYEDFHQVKYKQSALEEAVNLSVQYMPEKKLPDKAIDLIDEAGSYVNIKYRGGFEGKSNLMPVKSTKMPTVTVDVIKKITSKITKIPLETVADNEKESLKNIEINMKSKIFGQEDAISALTKAVKRSRAGFRNPDKPEASFLFVGPTGCGKTELAKTLADILHEPLLRYDMSEYQEKHTVSRLVGSPPGYVGFEEGGQLTKNVRKNPHSVILFDEIEKAHEDIYNVLLQVLDYGQLTDNQGRKSDFRSCIIILTSNAGARDLENPGIGFGTRNSTDIKSSLKEAVNKEFPPEFRNRLDAIIPFNFLDKQVAKQICKKEIKILEERLLQKKVELSVSEKCLEYLTELGYSKEFGARNIARTIEDKISNALVDEVLFGKLEKGGKIFADYNDKDIIFS